MSRAKMVDISREELYSLIFKYGKSVTEAAKVLKIGRSTLNNWISNEKISQQELVRLKARTINSQLETVSDDQLLNELIKRGVLEINYRLKT